MFWLNLWQEQVHMAWDPVSSTDVHWVIHTVLDLSVYWYTQTSGSNEYDWPFLHLRHKWNDNWYLLMMSIYLQCAQYSVMYLFIMFTIINKLKSGYISFLLFIFLSSLFYSPILSSIFFLLSIFYCLWFYLLWFFFLSSGLFFSFFFFSFSSSLWSLSPNWFYYWMCSLNRTLWAYLNKQSGIPLSITLSLSNQR